MSWSSVRKATASDLSRVSLSTNMCIVPLSSLELPKRDTVEGLWEFQDGSHQQQQQLLQQLQQQEYKTTRTRGFECRPIKAVRFSVSGDSGERLELRLVDQVAGRPTAEDVTAPIAAAQWIPSVTQLKEAITQLVTAIGSAEAVFLVLKPAGVVLSGSGHLFDVQQSSSFGFNFAD